MSELYSFKTEDLKKYRLRERPGLKDLIDSLQDESLGVSLKDGLRLALNSVIGTHQKIAQIISLADSGEEGINGLLGKFQKTKYYKEWHKQYLDIITIIDHTMEGAFKTLCSLIAVSSKDEIVEKSFEALKEGLSCPFESFYVPWGKGSIVHSLIDCCIIYLQDPKFERKLRHIFVEKVEKSQTLLASELSLIDRQIEELNSHFTENTEYHLMRKLELLEDQFKELEDQCFTHTLQDGMVLISPSMNPLDQVYGHCYEEEELVYKGELRSGVFHGIGELIASNTKVYIGGFTSGKPNGRGLWYDSLSRIRYNGECMDGQKHGVGECFRNDGSRSYRGSFYKNKRHGIGVEFYPDNKRKWAGNWDQDVKHGYGVLYEQGTGGKTAEGFWKYGEWVEESNTQSN